MVAKLNGMSEFTYNTVVAKLDPIPQIAFPNPSPPSLPLPLSFLRKTKQNTKSSAYYCIASEPAHSVNQAPPLSAEEGERGGASSW